ncbi:DNA alkylation repair protein [Aliiglaciecola lipolytica]|uniref:DNA alkylation repair protein n=1 Tax=Aliiglaciecola lipolytica TaxID=477689 RepID=UPI001C09C4FC|nr:DNA alkylation repair protein [Aliiglaciecola lipolytica]MBU2879636.1 DNA alkylation repair protein [Aliiglaciecola lipolytica]
MPEPLKNLFNNDLIAHMANHFSAHFEAFDCALFIEVASKNLAHLELKQRSNQIMQAMKDTLPDDFEHAAQIMRKSLAAEHNSDLSENSDLLLGLNGWAIMPMAEYVGVYGQENFDTSMALFHAFTQRFTSEFGIRHFLLSKPERTLSKLVEWCEDESHHVRRLASEGCRPRLPWGMQLPIFIQNPQPIIGLVEKLKDDKEEYVRRSVANNLNDIAKDHSDLVATTLKIWSEGANHNRKKLIRHAGRTLLKQGHPIALQNLGYFPPKLKFVKLEVEQNLVEFGSKLHFSLHLDGQSVKEQLLMIDFAIHHQKANGELKAKVFKWKSITLEHGQPLLLAKSHPFKAITTRRYYPGIHKIEVIINGVSVALKSFELKMDTQ